MKLGIIKISVIALGTLCSAHSFSQSLAAILVKDLDPSTGSAPSNFHQVSSGRYVFSATNASDQEIYLTDGTVGGTGLLMDINLAGSSNPYSFNNLGSKTYFISEQSGDVGVWVTEGTFASTVKAFDINAGGDDQVQDLVSNGSSLYFAANNGFNGREPYVSDGTGGGTTEIVDLEPGSAGSFPTQFCECMGKVFFAATTTSDGTEVFESDGAAGGTAILVDIASGNLSSNPALLTCSGGNLFFEADTNDSGMRELHVFDGVTTTLLAIGPAFGTTAIGEIVAFNDGVVFSPKDSMNENELYFTDGTPGGTERIDLNASGSSDPNLFFNAGSYVYFTANDGINDRELWRTDGTASGTELVMDINPTLGSNPEGFFQVGDTIFFSADDGSIGREIWYTLISDKTTALYLDAYVGATSSDPSEFFMIGQMLFFSGTTGSEGKELHRIQDPAIGLEELNEVSSQQLYPNPVSTAGILRTHTTGAYAFYSIDGRLLDTGFVSNGSLQPPSIPGTYVLKIQNHLNKIVVK